MRNSLVHLALVLISAVSMSMGTEEPPTVGVEHPAVSPDGRSLALVQGGRIHIIDLQTGTSRLLADKGEWQEHPTWSADGREVAFSALEEGRFHLYVASLTEESVQAVRGTFEMDAHARQPAWAGESIVFVRQEWDGNGSDLFIVDAQGDVKPLTTHEAADKMPSVSPDGTEVAFVSERSDDEEIWVIPIEGGDAKRLTFSEGEDLYPVWSPDGKRIAYSTERAGERYLAVIDADGGEPSVFHRGGGQPAWSKDGRSIFMVRLPPMPPDYNGNPTRLFDWQRSTVFPNHGAFELFRVPAPAPMDTRTRVAFAPLESRRERNLRVFDTVVATHRNLYYHRGPARETWNALAEELRPEAEAAQNETELEAVVDRLVAERPFIRREARSHRGVVASGHPLATEVGLDVLRHGGNVVDAAIAVSFMLGVVEPDASGIGGDGMMLIHLHGSGKTVAIDFKDQVPSHATIDNPDLFVDGRLKRHGPTAVNIPGPVAGMDLAFKKYGSGTIDWEDLVLPAARAAAEGVVVTPGLATTVAQGQRYLKLYPAAARIFLPDGQPLQAGDLLVNLDYAKTLQTIAEEGADAFYRGSIAEAIVRDMKANGGIITAQDLAQYRAIEREPLVGRYRDYIISTAPPPVSAGASLVQMLQILDNYPMEKAAHYRSDVDSLHYMVESWKKISRKRLVADPHIWDVDLTDVLSPGWAKARFETIDPKRASPDPSMPADESQIEEYQGERISTGTTAAVVADSEGNMVALTQTLSTWGGAFYLSDGVGFLYNNHLRGSRSRPGSLGSLTPLARSSTGICPTLVFRRRGDERVPFMAIGAAGNAWITASVYEVLTGIIDFGLSPQQAIEAPRFLASPARFLPDRPPIPTHIRYEQGITGGTIEQMRKRGHTMIPIGMKGELVMGYAAVAVVDLENKDVRAGTDPRRSYYAGGVQ